MNAKFIKDNKSILDNVDVSKQNAIKYAFVNAKLLLIYGAAGTGKTTLINYISSLLPKAKSSFSLKPIPQSNILKGALTILVMVLNS